MRSAGDDEHAVHEDQQRSPQQQVERDLQPGRGAAMVGPVFPNTGHQGRHPGCDGKRDHADSLIVRPASRTGFGGQVGRGRGIAGSGG